MRILNGFHELDQSCSANSGLGLEGAKLLGSAARLLEFVRQGEYSLAKLSQQDQRESRVCQLAHDLGVDAD